MSIKGTKWNLRFVKAIIPWPGPLLFDKQGALLGLTPYQRQASEIIKFKKKNIIEKNIQGLRIKY